MAAFGALSAPTLGALLASCSSDASTTPVSRATTSTSKPTPPTLPFDTSRPWWLQDNFAPVVAEVTNTKLEVTGAIPKSLSGLYVRNGSNPASGDSTHWFFGDGMAHGTRIEGGKAVEYRNRYVQTELYKKRQGFGGSGAPGGQTSQSNVSFINHAGKLLSSGEVGFPYEVSPTDLSTIGSYDFAGKLTTAFTAHPKIDSTTGNMHFFGYGFTDPYLTYHVADSKGTLISSETVKVAGPTMIHDFAITEQDVIFWELPVVFDLQSAIKWIRDPKSGEQPFQWQPTYGARIGVMPLGGPTSKITWHEIDPCYVFHGVNAYREGTSVIIDVCRLSSMFVRGEKFGGEGSLRRWTVNTASGKVADDIIETHESGDLPTRHPKLVGRKHRYGYLVQTRDSEYSLDMGGVIKQDYQTGTREVWDPGVNVHSGEWLFVPEPGATQEDAGYLMAYLYDAGTDRSDLAIIDATEIKKGPIARIHLPQRVPYGFHAAWVPAS